MFASVVSSTDSIASEWNRFRGPNGSGVAESDGVPIDFGPNRSVIWKTELPPGHSSPILSEDSVYLTATEGEDLWTYRLNRADGAIDWRQKAPRARITKVDDRNSSASPSPAVDSDGVYVYFPDFGLLAYETDGTERWRLPLPAFENVYGMGASPIVAAGKVILVCDQNRDSFVIAVDTRTGKEQWRAARPEAKSGHSTPIVYQPADGPLQVLIPGSFLMTSYSVPTGEKLWWVSGLSFEMKSTPVMEDGVVYVNGYGAPENQPGNEVTALSYAETLSQVDADASGTISREEATGHVKGWFGFVDLAGDAELDAEDWEYYQAALASKNGILGIRVGGEGDMTEQSVLWTYHRRVPQLPSPLLYRGVLYMVNDGGIVTALEPKSGKVLSQGRLKGAIDNYYASPVAADGKVFFASELGKIAVLEAGGSLTVQHVNDLDDLLYATPAIADGRLYVRTRSALFCFGDDADGGQ